MGGLKPKVVDVDPNMVEELFREEYRLKERRCRRISRWRSQFSKPSVIVKYIIVKSKCKLKFSSTSILESLLPLKLPQAKTSLNSSPFSLREPFKFYK